MIVLYTLLGMLFVFILILFLLANNELKEFANSHAMDFQFVFMAAASLVLVNKFHLIERSGVVQTIHHKIIRIYGARNGLAYTKMFLAQIFSAILLVMLLVTLITILANGDFMIFFFGVFFLPILVYGIIKDLDKKIKKKEQKVILELPELLNKITLLVNAGETLQNAIIRCVEQKKNIEGSPLYKELKLAANELKINHSFQKVMEEFNKRIGVQEVSIFTTTILLNYKRGGGDLIVALRELSNTLWERRKALSRTLGEEASSKLVFPMVFIFLVVMIIVASPAIMFMN